MLLNTEYASKIYYSHRQPVAGAGINLGRDHHGIKRQDPRFNSERPFGT